MVLILNGLKAFLVCFVKLLGIDVSLWLGSRARLWRASERLRLGLFDVLHNGCRYVARS